MKSRRSSVWLLIKVLHCSCLCPVDDDVTAVQPTLDETTPPVLYDEGLDSCIPMETMLT